MRRRIPNSKPNAKLLSGCLLLALASGATAQSIDSAVLISRIKARVRENSRTIPKFVCRQKLERQSFADAHIPGACGVLGENLPSKGSLIASDRAVLDVMLSQNSEMFAWPGARSFEAVDQQDLLGGGFSGNGDFATFVLSIFTVDAATFYYRGPCEPGACVRYTYNIPASVSHYVVRTGLDTATLGYHGSFDVDPQSADVLRLTVIPTDLPRAIPTACDARTRMNYTEAVIGAREFRIPASTEKQYLSSDGTRYVDRVSYEGCRQFGSESALKFDDPAAPEGEPHVAAALPPGGAEVQLRLSANVDSEHGAAGDAIEATLVRAVRDTEGRAIPAGTVFRGHVTRLMTMYAPQEQVQMAFRFDAIVLNGAAVPVNLTPIRNDRRGSVAFTFAGSKMVRGKGLVMRWRVVS